MKRIVVITPTNPLDQYGHSGVVYSICSQISKENVLVWLKPKNSVLGVLQNLFPLIYVYVLKALGYTVSHHPAISKMYACFLNRELKKIDYDCVLGFESNYLSYINTNKPILYRTDGVFRSMVDYYISNVPKHIVKQGDIVENRTLQKATYVLFPSKWVYDETLRYYPQINSSKLKIIESGANIPWVDKSFAQEKNSGNVLNLLFIGSDPVRKGVDVAIDCVKTLNEVFGKKAILTIIGGQFDFIQMPFINYVGRINKNKPNDNALFTDILKTSDFLLFPTKAECAGIVSCEAAAYGIPVLAYNTGGVSSYVIDGKNGHLFETDALGRDYANYLNGLTMEQIKRMSQNARSLYETKFNWEIWGNAVNGLIRDL